MKIVHRSELFLDTEEIRRRDKEEENKQLFNN